jgi:threonine dehydrogenase-like Zn-dependent dehydrogenase
MRATCWMGRNTVKVENVPDPEILNGQDAIVKITSTAICGSDLHLYDGYIPTMKKGDILGHEFMGEVVDVGGLVTKLKVGDRVVVPFPIACGNCNACVQGLYSVCENSNPNAAMAEKLMGHSPAGIYGGPIKIENGIPDEQVLFLSDIFPTGYMGAEMCDIKRGDIVAVWGAGPVGQFAIASAYMLGAERVIAIDRFPYRLRRAAEKAGAETINYEETDVLEALREITAGRGPDSCIDAVGMEAHHGNPAIYAYDRAKQATRMETDRPFAIREAIMACKNGGTISVIGVYGGFIDKFPMGSLMNRSLTVRTGQCHVQRYMKPLLKRITNGEIDPSFVVSHRMDLDDAPRGYEMFKNKEQECNKVVLKP